MAKTDTKNLTESLEQLSTIVAWFESQTDVDVEEGLSKVKEAAALIKDSKSRLADIENEFKEIEKEVRADIGTNNSEQPVQAITSFDADEIDSSEIPF
jgi:exonuclease VII small subunit